MPAVILLQNSSIETLISMNGTRRRCVIRFDLVTARVQDPAQLIPHLFDEIDSTLKERVKPGEFNVAGKNFFSGKAHNQGMIAMKALGLRVLCESMPFRSFRAATG
jgi:3-isopropylmalate/(R)-2-methylmalate dehydratase small subunit